MPSDAREDHQMVDEILYEEYWYLTHWSGFYLKKSSYQWEILSKAYVAVLTILIMSFCLTCLVTAVLVYDEITELFQSIHYASLCFIALFQIIPCLHYRSTFEAANRVVAYGLSAYSAETESCRRMFKLKIRKYKKALTVGFLTYFSVLPLFLFVFLSLLDGFSEETREKYKTKGVVFDLPITQWTPIGADTLMTFAISVLFQFIVFGILEMVIMTSMIYYINISLHIAMEMKVLIVSIKRLSERAEQLYRSRNQTEWSSALNTQEQIDCYAECLKQSAIHHQKIIHAFNDYNKAMSMLFAVVYGLCSVTIAFSGFLIVISEGRFGARILCASYCLAELFSVFCMAWGSEQINQEAENLTMALYSSKWMLNGKPNALTIQVMMIRSQIPMIFNYSKLCNIDYKAFSTVVNSAYSYFNLLFAMLK